MRYVLFVLSSLFLVTSVVAQDKIQSPASHYIESIALQRNAALNAQVICEGNLAEAKEQIAKLTAQVKELTDQKKPEPKNDEHPNP